MVVIMQVAAAEELTLTLQQVIKIREDLAEGHEDRIK
jgi:hypothetical protein